MTTSISGSYPAVNSDSDATINGLTVGKGTGAVANNTAVGASALNATNTGTGLNTSVGAFSLFTNTSGSESVAVGYEALRLNTTGTYNVALGQGSLRSNTTANENTAVGNNSMRTNTTGAANSALGAGALFANTTGTGNTALGFGTGVALTTGGGNTIVGREAGEALTTASNCTFVGTYSGEQTTGATNTFVGYESGYLVTTGAENTIIGRYNGNAGGLDIRTATGYIVLSNGADWKAYFNGSAGGWFQVSNSSSWATTSDQRIKENIVDVTNGLAKIVALRPVEFDYKIGEKAHDVGFIAQEYETVFPEQIIEQSAGGEEIKALTNNEPVKGIQQNLVPYLVKAIQELKAEVDSLKQQINGA